MWGVGGLQVYGICSCRLVYSEVVEARQTIRNLTCGDQEIPLVVIRLGDRARPSWCTSWTYLEERKEKGLCDLVCVKHF